MEKTAEQVWDNHFEGWVMAGQIRTEALLVMEKYAQQFHTRDEVIDEIKTHAEKICEVAEIHYPASNNLNPSVNIESIRNCEITLKK